MHGAWSAQFTHTQIKKKTLIVKGGDVLLTNKIKKICQLLLLGLIVFVEYK